MLDLESGDSGAKLKPKGSTKEPTSGPTPGGNVIKIETREGGIFIHTCCHGSKMSKLMDRIDIGSTKDDALQEPQTFPIPCR